MKKTMLIPLAFLLILSIYSGIQTGLKLSGASQDFSTIEGIEIDGEDASIDIDEGGSHDFNIWEGTYAIIIVVTAMGIGILAGITVLGSGLKDFSQRLIFNGIMYLGLWACLSLVSVLYMFANVYTTLIWIGLTVMYTVGLGNHMANGVGG